MNRDVSPPLDLVIALSDPDMAKLDCIHSGARHRVYRGRINDRQVVLKLPAAAPGIASLRHEYDLLRNLNSPGVVEVLGLVRVDEGLALLMADAGDADLAKLIRVQPLPVPIFLDVAIQLAATVGHLHRARIVHRDINPSNIVWDANGRRATLCDCATATTLSALTHTRNHLEGTLAYVSPEQTGRTGRSVDSRTDLYSLGASFYEMLIGLPPFTAKDAVELVHAHIARRPQPPHELNTRVPLALSMIVLKLLEKEPEQRYQTADALAMDLEEARAQWTQTAAISPFPLATHDTPPQLRIPDKLYGRDTEVQILNQAFARARRGGRELVLIAGAPGIGKSALVNQLGFTVAEHSGLYTAGKFDQLQRSEPFSGLALAFRGLARQLLMQPEPVLAAWRSRIEDAIAPNGQLLVSIVPELGRILGPQPAVPAVGLVESKNRFQSVFTRFVAVFARREHPLALFLDDLQWVDAASLQLIEQWLGDNDCGYLLFVGAYRDGEVESSHPLAISLTKWRSAGRAIEEIRLGPMQHADISQLTREAFNEDGARTQLLSELILRKTAGNPFFVRRLLHLLHGQGLIRYLQQARQWHWEMNELERAPVTDNVLDLMVQSIERLPAPTRTLLEIGSCIGFGFDSSTLADVSGLSRATTADQLGPALEDGLLLPVRDAYEASTHASPSAEGREAPPTVVQFAHDRVQQAAYSMLSPERRRSLHLEVGRRLLSTAGSDALNVRLFDIVDQLNLGESLIVAPAERLQLVELNLAAGRKAKASAAYQAAHEYLTVAMHQLTDTKWDEQAHLTSAIHRELAECAYLTGQHAQAEELIEIALAHTSSKLVEADLYTLRVLAATVAGDWLRALRWGREALAVFGLEWPLEGSSQANEAEAAAVMTNLGDRRIEDLLNAPEVQNEETRAAMRLMSILGPPAYFSGAEVLTFLVTRAANLSLRYGPSPYSAYAYVFYGALHNARTGEYDVGYEFGKLALALARRFGDRAEESRTLEVFGLVVQPWKAPVRDSLPLLRDGFRAGVESGELAYAAFNLNSVLINGLPAGVSLPELLADVDVAIEFATRYKNQTSLEMALPFRQLGRSLTGTTRALASFDDDDFEEAQFLEAARSNHTALGFYWVARLQTALLLGDYAIAQHASQMGAAHVNTGILGMLPSAEHVFYSALLLAANPEEATGSQRAALNELLSLHRKLVGWAEHCHANFAHKAALVGAEIARLEGDQAEAMKLYRMAIDGAANERCIQDEALAHELRARCLLGSHEPALAAVHFRAAHDRYLQWGATAKAHALERAHPGSFASEPRPSAGRMSIDALALIKASQAISAETIPERVFEQILRVLVEVAGAQSGALVLCEHDELTVRARIRTASGIAVSLGTTPLEASEDIPSAILRYVARTKETLVLSAAAAAGAFTSDPVVQRRNLRSVLCVPLTQQSKIVGLLYLENDAMTGAFADDLIEVMQVLAAQTVISLENARLHEASQHEIQHRKQAEQQLSEADRRKDEFLAMLAHELRNPLAPIGSASELLIRTRPGDSGVQSAVGIIKRQTAQLTRLVDDLLDVSRVTQGRIQLTRQPIDLATVIRHAVETVEPLIRAKQHRLSIDARHEPVYVEGDFARLGQCVGNVLANAVKFTEASGQIFISMRADDTTGIVEVADTGAGISPQLLPRVFDLFVQSERTLDRAQGGLGVGLAIVKRLVQMHGGEVVARSDGAGRGSTFQIRLPRVEAPQASAPITAASSVTARRILVVDDNEDAANSIALLLDLQGQETAVAFSGQEALERLESFSPNFVLLDLGMPQMDGYEIARRIRAMPQFSHVRIVALTGYGQAEDRQRTRAAGFDAHLVKPTDIAVLEKTLAGL